MKNYQAIFQVKAGTRWLDYVRQPVDRPDDAIANIRLLERQTGDPFRASVEDWSDGGTREPTIYYGDWNKSELSPAAQENGIFKPAFFD